MWYRNGCALAVGQTTKHASALCTNTSVWRQRFCFCLCPPCHFPACEFIKYLKHFWCLESIPLQHFCFPLSHSFGCHALWLLVAHFAEAFLSALVSLDRHSLAPTSVPKKKRVWSTWRLLYRPWPAVIQRLSLAALTFALVAGAVWPSSPAARSAEQ